MDGWWGRVDGWWGRVDAHVNYACMYSLFAQETCTMNTTVCVEETNKK